MHSVHTPIGLRQCATSGALSMVGLLQAVQQPCVEALVPLGSSVSCQAGPRQLQWVQQPRLQVTAYAQTTLLFAVITSMDNEQVR